MANAFPSRYELKCSGLSFLTAQVLILFGIFMHSINYDAYAVQTEEQVVALHNILSSPKHRTETEIAVTALWIAFPLLLIGLFGIKKFMVCIHANSAGEMWIFTAIQSYIIFIAIVCVIIPALVLTTSAFEWSFNEYSPEPDVVPTGYYIQLYLVIFANEIVDCVAIADAVFMISLCILPRFLLNNTAKIKKLKSVMDPDLPNCLKNMQCFVKCFRIFTVVLAISLFIIFCIIIFEFAASGFFSPSGHAKFLMIFSFVLKILIGIRIAWLGFSKKYEAIKEIFDDQGHNMLASNQHNYKMEQVVIGTDDKKENENQHHDNEL